MPIPTHDEWKTLAQEEVRHMMRERRLTYEEARKFVLDSYADGEYKDNYIAALYDSVPSTHTLSRAEYLRKLRENIAALRPERDEEDDEVS